MEPAFDFWTVAMTIAAFQGIFLSTLIFLRKSKVNNLLGAFVLSFSFCLLFYVLYWTNYLSYFPFEMRVLNGLTFLLGPLMFFYIKSGAGTYLFKPVHFTPAIIYFVLYFTIKVWEIAPLLQVAQTLHLIVYSLSVYLAVRSKVVNTKGAKILMNWRRKLAWAFIGYTGTFLTYYILVWTDQLELSYDYAISIASCIFIYYIGIQGFSKHNLLQQYENGKYAKGLLPKSAADSILKSLKSHMELNKPFLSSSFRLVELAETIKISSHDLSQALNEYEGKSFTEFVNTYRVDLAKMQLMSSKDKKIIHIAYDCGFNNKVSFSNAFKKSTGMSPSQYRDLDPIDLAAELG